jgi:hypothetical protein
MKSKLLVLALSMFAMSFVAANDTVDVKTVPAADTSVEINADQEVAAADKDVAAEEAAKAKKAAEAKTQDQNSCKSCK